MIKLILRLIALAVMVWIVGLVGYALWIDHSEPYEGKAQGAVVLTGGEGRVEAGLRLLEQGRVQRLLISGVHQDVKVTELLELNKRSNNLANRIDLGFTAQDTLGNADETVSWIEKHNLESLIVVTSNYHMPRALIHLGQQLPNVALYPFPIVPKPFRKNGWWKDQNARRLVINDYNKFLLTYPQILLLRYTSSP